MSTNNKKKYIKPAIEEVTPEVVEDAVEETIEVDTTDETKVAEEFVNAKSAESVPVYHIRVEWGNIATQKQSFTDVNVAIRECNKYPGYKVFTEDGNPIHISTALVKMSSNNAVTYQGKRYDLNEAKLFANATIDTAKGIVTGTYYLYDAQLINGRYRIVDDKAKVGKGIQFVLGYVAVEEM